MSCSRPGLIENQLLDLSFKWSTISFFLFLAIHWSNWCSPLKHKQAHLIKEEMKGWQWNVYYMLRLTSWVMPMLCAWYTFEWNPLFYWYTINLYKKHPLSCKWLNKDFTKGKQVSLCSNIFSNGLGVKECESGEGLWWTVSSCKL